MREESRINVAVRKRVKLSDFPAVANMRRGTLRGRTAQRWFGGTQAFQIETAQRDWNARIHAWQKPKTMRTGGIPERNARRRLPSDFQIQDITQLCGEGCHREWLLQ